MTSRSPRSRLAATIRWSTCYRSAASESNVCGYRNDTFDLLVGVAESTGDLTARAAFLHDAEAMLLEDSAVSPLCFSGTAYLLREGLTGVSHDCFGHSYFTAVSRAETSSAA